MAGSYVASWPSLGKDSNYDNSQGAKGRNAVSIDINKYGYRNNSKINRNQDVLSSDDESGSGGQNSRKNKRFTQKKGRTSSHHLLPCRGLIACSACSYPECHFLHDARFIGCTSTLVHARKWPDGEDIFFYYGEEDANAHEGYHVPWSYSASPRQQQRATFSMISHLLEHLCNHRERDVKFEFVVDGPDIAFNRYLGSWRLAAFRNMSKYMAMQEKRGPPLSSCVSSSTMNLKLDLVSTSSPPSWGGIVWKVDDDCDSDLSSECTTTEGEELSQGLWSPLIECPSPELTCYRPSGVTDTSASDEDSTDCGCFELEMNDVKLYSVAPSLKEFLEANWDKDSASETDNMPNFLHVGRLKMQADDCF